MAKKKETKKKAAAPKAAKPKVEEVVQEAPAPVKKEKKEKAVMIDPAVAALEFERKKAAEISEKRKKVVKDRIRRPN